ncbi:MAG: hypothetical protein KAS18_05075 [Calditrichia bacterium]|nr:hypothetical protein [Calditrichia bacterium]
MKIEDNMQCHSEGLKDSYGESLNVPVIILLQRSFQDDKSGTINRLRYKK